ncbi:MAG TPA: MFS transporter, partial [Telluria sp.]|nr:MFS transporter [Telluria sp.]
AAPRTARARTGVPLDAVTLRAILGHPVFRRTVSLVLLPHAVFFAVQGMWLGRWLADVGHFGEGAVAYLLYLSMAAVVFGAIAVGMVTEWAGRHGLAPRGVAVAGVTLFLLVQTALMIGYRPAFQTLPVLFTLAGSVTGIEYTIVAQGVPSELTGRAATCLNLLIFVAAFAVQAGFGLVLGCWTPDAAGHYPAQAYRAAFALLIAVQLPGLVQCVLASNRSDEHHETAPLRPPGKGKTGTAG